MPDNYTSPQLERYPYHRTEHVVMLIGFVICWAPFTLIYIPALIGTKEKLFQNTVIDVLPLMMVKLVCAIINPVVYVFEKYDVSILTTEILSKIDNAMFWYELDI